MEAPRTRHHMRPGHIPGSGCRAGRA